MKIYYYLILLVLTASCGQTSKTEKEPRVETQGAVEIIEEAVDSLPKSVHLDFDEVLAQTKTKKLPHIEATNFDSFIDEDDNEELNFKTFKLDQIYPDFNLNNNNFKAISAYTVPISDSFHTVVITVQKNENEMETVLINYDSTGEILAHKIASYDEIAEGWSQIVSRISENQLTVNRVFWGEIKQIEQEEYMLHNNGEIEKIDSKNLNESIRNFAPVNAVLTELKLDWVQTKTNLITSAQHPINTDETIVVVPEIVDEGEMYFDLNSHIVVADKNTGKIKNKYFESHQTNNWLSDAVRLDGIQIDPNPYKITEDRVAFGINVSHFGSSRVNPYSNKTLSLFVKSGDSLLKVLSDYTIEDYGGEWNGDCDGEFTEEKKWLVMRSEKTNGYFDIDVMKKLNYTKQFNDKKGDCLATEKDETKNVILKFNGNTYIETEANTSLYFKFHPKKLENLQIDRLELPRIHQLKDFKIATGYYKPVDRQAVAPHTGKDWGYRLLMLNASNKIVYTSQGFGDLYTFEPHFYKSDASNKIIIICQLGYEYPFGGEAFILDNNKITYIGTLDIEGYDPEQMGSMYMTEIVEIREGNSSIHFSFKADKLVLKPGSEDEVIINNNVQYVYKNNELSLLSNKR